MASDTLKEALTALKAGGISFDEFARRTHRDWNGLAHYLMGRWAVPGAVEHEDVVQELLVAAWQHVDKWDAEHPSDTSLATYVVFNATDKAKKWLHKQRAAKRQRDNAPSRNAVSLDVFDPGVVDTMMATGPDQEHAVARMQSLAAALATCKTRRDVLCVQALAECGGSVARAAALLYDDPAVRRVCRFDSRRNARLAVARAGWRVLRRVVAPAA